MHPKVISDDAALSTASHLGQHDCHLHLLWHWSTHLYRLGNTWSLSIIAQFFFERPAGHSKSFLSILHH